MLQLKIYKDGLADELTFLLRLQHDLPSLSLEKTADKYYPVDYIIKSNDGITRLFIEIKNRNLDLSKFNTLLIGRGKLENINTMIRHNVILTWVCKTTQTLYWMYYHKFLLDLKIHMLNGKRVCYVNKSLCSTGYDELTGEIYDVCTSS